jgi:hypothetical protein
VVTHGTVPAGKSPLLAGTDAASAGWFPVAALPALPFDTLKNPATGRLPLANPDLIQMIVSRDLRSIPETPRGHTSHRGMPSKRGKENRGGVGHNPGTNDFAFF